MAGDTKERILNKALEMFATGGYKGTNLRDLADALGLSKSALYRHFESKEAIWNALLDQMDRYYAANIGFTKSNPVVPGSAQELKDMTLRMVNFTMHDEKVVLSRKILTVHQFTDEKSAELATLHFNKDTEALFTKAFEGMMANGIIEKGNPEMLAFAYTSPITTLVQWHDREPEAEKQINEKIEKFVDYFIETYGVK